MAGYYYCMYGLRLRSQWPFPYLITEDSRLPETEEIELFEGSVSLFSKAQNEAAKRSRREEWLQYLRLSDGSDYLRWSGLFEFLISADGSRIAGSPLSETSWEAFHTYLFGQVLSFALLKKGIEPLHSTSVVINGKAVSFMGDCSYGKSSLGAAFLHSGHSLLTDDLLVVQEEDHGFTAYPGTPRIKLFPKIARSMLGREIKGVPMNKFTRKLIIPLNGRQFFKAAAPLKVIYVLTPPAAGSRQERVTIRKLSQRRAFLKLLKNTFNAVIIEPERLKRQFNMAVRLSANIPIKSLSYPRYLPCLQKVVESIVLDLTRQGRE